MCGIVGYAGGNRAANVIFNGLKELEYRGYDSAGIAVLDDGKLSVVKKRGRVESLKDEISALSGSVGIGHTRWATHGAPSDINAHPHRAGRCAIVHNGIIENYAELKRELEEDGAVFLSETDSEVAAKLFERLYSGDIRGAIVKVAKLLKGSYALMVTCEDFEGFAVAKLKSPVILGFGDGENFCASDEPALAGRCRNICVLEDGDFALVTAEKVEIFDGNLNPVKRKILPNTARSGLLELGDCPHYMLKELREAPAAVKNTLSAFIERERGIYAALSDADRVILTGCGTAYHAALAAKKYFEEFAKINVEVEYASELRYSEPAVTSKTALLAVTQSGETADTVEAARLFKSLGARVVAVTNSPNSAITRLADAVLPVAAGPEICVAATKSYSGQLAALYLAAAAVSDGNFARMAKRLGNMPDLMKFVVQKDLSELAEMCVKSKGVYFMGRGADFAVALEASLKLKEVSYIAGGGYPAGELKHGPLALIDGDTAAVFIICDGKVANKAVSAVYEVLARGGKVGVISNIPAVISEFAGRVSVVELPECDRELAPLLAASAVHVLAYRAAVLLGRDPDKPRNLAKSVTVE